MAARLGLQLGFKAYGVHHVGMHHGIEQVTPLAPLRVCALRPAAATPLRCQ